MTFVAIQNLFVFVIVIFNYIKGYFYNFWTSILFTVLEGQTETASTTKRTEFSNFMSIK